MTYNDKLILFVASAAVVHALLTAWSLKRNQIDRNRRSQIDREWAEAYAAWTTRAEEKRA